MDKLIQQFVEFNGKSGLIIFEHVAFERQIFFCNELLVFYDNDRIGVRVMNKDVYILFKDITSFDYNNNECIISTRRKSIKIKIANI